MAADRMLASGTLTEITEGLQCAQVCRSEAIGRHAQRGLRGLLSQGRPGGNVLHMAADWYLICATQTPLRICRLALGVTSGPSMCTVLRHNGADRYLSALEADCEAAGWYK